MRYAQKPRRCTLWDRTGGIMIGILWTLYLLGAACVIFQGVKYAARMVTN